MFINLTISLIHPELFQMGLDMLRKLRDMEETEDVAEQWQSVCTGIAVICNRRTPHHRDSKGRREWFDILISYSDDEISPRLLIGNVGLDLQYSSGTVVGFCGSVLGHEVQSRELQNRICYAHFMRESVRQCLETEPAGWVWRSQYLPLQEVDDGAVGMDADEDAMEL